MSEPAAGRPLRLTASLEGSAGRPVLVLGNSLGTSRAIWEPQVPALAAHFRLLRYELPGHGGDARAGAPDPPPGPYSIAGLGAAVLALLDSRGIDRASYCGISLGGMIGMWLAANAPARIAALGLCCTSAHMPPASGWTGRAALVRAEGMAPVTGPSLGRWFTPAFARSSPAVLAAVAAMLDSTDPEGYAGCCEAIAAMDLRPSLGSITVTHPGHRGQRRPVHAAPTRRADRPRDTRCAAAGDPPGRPPGQPPSPRRGHRRAPGAPPRQPTLITPARSSPFTLVGRP